MRMMKRKHKHSSIDYFSKFGKAWVPYSYPTGRTKPKHVRWFLNFWFRCMLMLSAILFIYSNKPSIFTKLRRFQLIWWPKASSECVPSFFIHNQKNEQFSFDLHSILFTYHTKISFPYSTIIYFNLWGNYWISCRLARFNIFQLEIFFCDLWLSLK